MVHTFKYKDKYFALDVESGSVHILNQIAYDAINIIEAHKDKEVLMKQYSKELCNDVFEEIDELTSQGLLFSEREYDPEDIKAFHPVCKALCLNITTGCNFRCAYCFAEAGNIVHEDMSFETAKKAIDFLVQNSEDRINLEVDFFGGEPTINFDVVKKTVEYAKTLEKKHNKNFRFTLTTNGYSLTDDMIDFMNEEMKNIVISMDGRKSVHNSIRKTAGGEETYDVVLNNAKKIVEGRKGREYYIRGTFTNKNTDFSNDIIDIFNQGFKEVSIEPVVTSKNMAISENDLDEILKHYELLADYLIENKDKGYHFFHFNIDFSGGPCLNKRLRGCGAGVEYFAVNPDGKIYPCHQFASNSDFILGDLDKGIINHKLVEDFSTCNIYTKEKCIDCFAKYYCSGGCLANAYNFNKDFNKPYSLECEMMKKRVELSIITSVLGGKYDRSL